MLSTTIIQLGAYAFEIYYWLILIAIFGSWFPQFQTSKIGLWVHQLVEPYLGFFRRFIPPLGPIDFSPIIALLALRYLSGFALEGLRQSLNFLGI
ncbi:YggT family protein [Neobacillus thermocopriae]|uniref:YggT family protein n=1 Tax=Neobacillus thermocopriae TaxID=1215031 RepID=UPI002E1E3829|nr:YggT family protein [Neobacillus thermocopriae]MED3714772.1 YggT family protein [Neobacillus thermocopriae]